MVVIFEVRANGETVGAISASPRDFKTGSRGFFGTGKVTINGKRCQAQVQLVEIGSKPSAESAEPVAEETASA